MATYLKVIYGKCYEHLVDIINRYAKECGVEIVSFSPISQYKAIVLFKSKGGDK